MTAFGYVGGDPRKLDRAGYSKGQLVAADATGALQAVPGDVNGLVLTTDSTEPTGVDWEAGGGGGGTPSGTVVTETSFGQGSTPGVANTFSRGDHTHGTPGAPSVPVILVRKNRITSGDVLLNLGAGAWNQLVTLTLSVPAAVGDYVELEAPLFMTQSGNAFLDLAVVVAGVAVRYASTDTNTPAIEGLPALYKDPNQFRTSMGPWGFVVTVGDLAAGSVNFSVWAKGTTGTLFASVQYPFIWSCKNFGVVNFA
jgi:hypothetical protein